MPVNLNVPDLITPVPGVQLGSIAAGLKKNGAADLVLVSLAPTSRVAAVFTRNTYCAAPVVVAREHLKACSGDVRALLINSGGANAATGAQGINNARAHCASVAELLDIDAIQVLPFSTGVIGEQLPEDIMHNGINKVHNCIGESAQHWRQAAEGIMTTDTTYKQFSVQVEIAGADKPLTVAGYAKGSGMIQPNMATMLAYMFTDADVPEQTLQNLLREVVDESFNSVTVDGDTSTNDACVLAATAASGVTLDESHTDWAAFRDAVEEVSSWLSHALVRDGEGASKFITINVHGGIERADCCLLYTSPSPRDS